MSTQQVRNLMSSQVDAVLSRAKTEIKTEAQKKIKEVKQSIPTPKEITKQLLVDVNEDTCSEKGMEKFNKQLTLVLGKTTKMQNQVKGALESIEKIEEKVDPLFNDSGPIGKISQLQQNMETYIMPILQGIMIAVPISMAVLKGPAADVKLGYDLGERKKKANAKLKAFASLLIMIPLMIKYYKEKGEKIMEPIKPVKSNLEFLEGEITKTKAYIAALQLRFEQGCSDLANAGDTSEGGDGDNPPAGPEQTELDAYLQMLEQQYNEVYQTLKAAGNEKAIERIFAIKETFEEDFNISFKIVNLND
jgi:hypothetical protein